MYNYPKPPHLFQVLAQLEIIGRSLPSSCFPGGFSTPLVRWMPSWGLGSLAYYRGENLNVWNRKRVSSWCFEGS